MSNTIKVSDFRGGLATGDPTTIEDNQLAIAKNVRYDNRGLLSTRKGIADFGNEIAGANGIHSIYYTRFNDGTRILLCAEGTTVYRYNEGTSNWDSIDATMDDGTPIHFITYKDVVYWANGVDSMRSYDGTTVSTHALAGLLPNYLAVQNDVVYTCGIATDPSTVFYTDANPASVQADGFKNDVPINQDEGYITGIHPFGAIVVVGKSKGIYTLNVFSSPNETIEAIDFEGNLESHRSMVSIENDLFVMSREGVYSLAQRGGTTGSYRAFPFTRSVQELVDRIDDKSTVCGIYFPDENNLYYGGNVDQGSTNDTLLVYSNLVSRPQERRFAWTQYENINANDFTIYTDADGDRHMLVANAFGGQVIEMETGWTDDGIEIRGSVRTKTFDFGAPEGWKTFPEIDAGGLISSQEEVDFSIDIDGVTTTKSFTGTQFAIGDDADPFPLGEEDMGNDPLGSGPISEEGIAFYPFIVRRPSYSSGLRVWMQFDTTSLNSGFKLNKLNIPVELHGKTVFPRNNIIT